MRSAAGKEAKRGHIKKGAALIRKALAAGGKPGVPGVGVDSRARP